MSSFLYNERCPRCSDKGADRTGDNLAVYSDGHKWCYACGYYEKGDVVKRFQEQAAAPMLQPCKWFTSTGEIPPHPYMWLKMYGLSADDIADNFFWQQEPNLHGEAGWLVFDHRWYEGGERKYQCARNFTGRGPKYKTKGIIKGNEIVFHKTGSNMVVFVEDAISALKVSKVMSAVPIHNAVIPLELAQRLSKRFSKAGVWLDMDKQKESLVERSKVGLYFPEVKVIWSEKDPKCYPTSQIEQYLLT